MGAALVGAAFKMQISLLDGKEEDTTSLSFFSPLLLLWNYMQAHTRSVAGGFLKNNRCYIFQKDETGGATFEAKFIFPLIWILK